MANKKIWIGLAHVKPMPGNDLLEGAIGAFVPVIALAENDSDFASCVVTLLNAYEFDVPIVEDIELWETRRERGDIDIEIVELAAGISPDNPIALSQFEAYESE